jgi:hypothetical protein
MRAFFSRRKDINNAAANAEIAALLHQRDVLEAPLRQMREQLFARKLLPDD